MPELKEIVFLLLSIVATTGGFFLLAGAVLLVARRLRLLRMEKATVQMRSIPEPGSSDASTGTTSQVPAHGLGAPRLRETSVPAWASRVIVLETPVVTIGRSLDNDVVLPEDEVSAEHCRLQRDGPSFRLIDLGSTNKTRVNGHEVADVVLRDGDQIRIGQTTFAFEWPHEHR